MTINETKKFLQCVSRGWSLSRAAREAGVSVADVQNEKKKDAYFAQRWETAFNAGTDRMEDCAAERAINGTSKGVWYKGQLVGWQTEYSDTLLMFMLKGRRPDKFAHFSVGADKDGLPPAIRGEDAAAWIEQKLAGFEAKRLALGVKAEDSEGSFA